MKTIQQQCADRLYEILPHKKELKFGCMVKTTIEGSNYYTEDVYTLGHDNCYTSSKDSHPFKMETIDAKNFEIIGQPIRLADILTAIKECNNGFYLISLNGRFHKKIEDGFNELGDYDLSQDNILSQSNEFCEMLYKLIK